MEANRSHTPVTRVLVVEPSAGDVEVIRQAFAAYGPAFDVSIVHTLRRARAAVDARSVDAVVAAERLEDGLAIDLIVGAKRAAVPLPLIIISDGENVRAAVAALRAGAAEYRVRSGQVLGGLPLTVTRVVGEWRRLEAERRQALLGQRAVSVLDALPDFVGIADPDGRVIYVNRAGRALLGASNGDDLRGCRIHELFPDWSVAEFVPTTQTGTEIKWNEDARMRRREGSEMRMRQAVLAHVTSGAVVDYFTIIARARPTPDMEHTGGTDAG